IGIKNPDNSRLYSMEGMVCHRYSLLETFCLIVDATRTDGIHITPIFFRLWITIRITIDLRGRSDKHPRFFGTRQTEEIMSPQRSNFQRLDGDLQVINRTGW